MVAIERENLKDIEHLFEQSALGFHLLFDRKSIAEILKTPTETLDFFNFETVNRVQTLFAEFLEKRTYVEKMVYLKNLESDAYEILVRAYFNIVENAMFETSKIRH